MTRNFFRKVWIFSLRVFGRNRLNNLLLFRITSSRQRLTRPNRTKNTPTPFAHRRLMTTIERKACRRQLRRPVLNSELKRLHRHLVIGLLTKLIPIKSGLLRQRNERNTILGNILRGRNVRTFTRTTFFRNREWRSPSFLLLRLLLRGFLHRNAMNLHPLKKLIMVISKTTVTKDFHRPRTTEGRHNVRPPERGLFRLDRRLLNGINATIMRDRRRTLRLRDEIVRPLRLTRHHGRLERPFRNVMFQLYQSRRNIHNCRNIGNRWSRHQQAIGRSVIGILPVKDWNYLRTTLPPKRVRRLSLHSNRHRTKKGRPRINGTNETHDLIHSINARRRVVKKRRRLTLIRPRPTNNITLKVGIRRRTFFTRFPRYQYRIRHQNNFTCTTFLNSSHRGFNRGFTLPLPFFGRADLF